MLTRLADFTAACECISKNGAILVEALRIREACCGPDI